MLFKFATFAFVPAVLMASPLDEPMVDYSMDGFEGIMCDSDVECEEATGYPYDVAMQDAFHGRPFRKYPTLVGIGCKGTNGPIYAFEVHHLPLCREVWEMDWDWRNQLERE
jgi:hypothetical protein